MKPYQHEIGVGATDELSLRVSVATLCRVLFRNPEDGRTMIALERTATLQEVDGQPEVTVRAKPFGGAVQVINSQALQHKIGDFRYDSERSRREQDFRLQIPPAAWEKVKEICREHVKETENVVLHSSPDRELAEEFEDTLRVRLTPDQYHLKQRGIRVEDLPVETNNVRAVGRPTVRLYYIFDAWIAAPKIMLMMLDNSRRYSDKDLQSLAWNDARQGGRGRANAVLVLGREELQDVYQSITLGKRGGPLRVGGHQLDSNVLAILEVDNPKYQLDIRHAH